MISSSFEFALNSPVRIAGRVPLRSAARVCSCRGRTATHTRAARRADARVRDVGRPRGFSRPEPARHAGVSLQPVAERGGLRAGRRLLGDSRSRGLRQVGSPPRAQRGRRGRRCGRARRRAGLRPASSVSRAARAAARMCSRARRSCPSGSFARSASSAGAVRRRRPDGGAVARGWIPRTSGEFRWARAGEDVLTPELEDRAKAGGGAGRRRSVLDPGRLRPERVGSRPARPAGGDAGDSRVRHGAVRERCRRLGRRRSRLPRAVGIRRRRDLGAGTDPLRPGLDVARAARPRRLVGRGERPGAASSRSRTSAGIWGRIPSSRSS